MTQGEVMSVFQEAILVVMKMAGPMLVLSMIVGLIIAVFQAATSIHEQTLTFVPKVLTIALFLLIAGSWLMTTMDDFVQMLFSLMAGL